MKQFDKKVYWEFNCRLGGFGHNAKEALYDAVREKFLFLQDGEASLKYFESVEANEVVRIDEKLTLKSVQALDKVRKLFDEESDAHGEITFFMGGQAFTISAKNEHLLKKDR